MRFSNFSDVKLDLEIPIQLLICNNLPLVCHQFLVKMLIQFI